MDDWQKDELLVWGTERHAHRCTGCPKLGRLKGEEQRAAGDGCQLRDVLLDDPALSFCASHPDWSGDRPRRPTGPVVAQDPEDPERLVVLAPCSRAKGADAAHVELLHLMAGDRLPLRDRLVIWQVLEYGDRDATLQLDRIAAERDGHAGAAPWEMPIDLQENLEPSWLDHLLGFPTRDAWDTGGWYERFTFWGRLVLVLSGTLAALVVVGTAFGLVTLVHRVSGIKLGLMLGLLAGMLTFGLFVRLGRFILERLELDFFQSADRERGGERAR